MPRAFMDVSAELLVDLCTGLKAGEEERVYRIAEGGLPHDTKVISCQPHGSPSWLTVRIELESDEFVEGSFVDPILQSVYKRKSNDS